MIKYKLLAVAILIFIVFAQEFSGLRAEGAETKEAKLIEHTVTSGSLKNKLASPAITHTVSASVYFPEPEQTDDTPFITADGSIIDENDPGHHRWIAVSRDLLSRWGGEISYGDSLLVSGISEELDGLYVVRDTMHSRIRNRIDILVGRQDNIMGFWEEVSIAKVN